MVFERWETKEISTRLGLVSREDDFSVQFSSSRDPRFWLRIELPVGSVLDLTDFSCGVMTEKEQADALHVAISHTGSAKARGLIFRDIAPSDDALELRRMQIVRIVELYASSRGRFIDHWGKQERRGKYDLMVQFKV